MNRRLILRLMLLFFGVVGLAGFACVVPWLTTLGLICTEHSSEVGYEGASIWHSGLPFRFLTRSDLSVGGTFDSGLYWSDVAFWFVAFLLVVVATRYWLRRPRPPVAA